MKGQRSDVERTRLYISSVRDPADGSVSVVYLFSFRRWRMMVANVATRPAKTESSPT